jgi:hypothetical protein
MKVNFNSTKKHETQTLIYLKFNYAFEISYNVFLYENMRE